MTATLSSTDIDRDVCPRCGTKLAEMRNPPLEEGRDQVVGFLRYYASMPYADASNETVRVRAVLLTTAAAEIDRLTAENEKLKAALNRSVTAIDDWLHQYAGELCDKKPVAESEKRIGEYGTIGYIATVQQQNREALEGIRTCTG